jgi:hypothetical protein
MAIASMITSWSGIEASSPLLAVGALLVSAVALRPLWLRAVRDDVKHSFTRTFLAVSAGVLLMLLTARLVWPHYMVLALPAILWVARNSIDRRGISGGISALAIFLLTPFSTNLLAAITGTFLSWVAAWEVALLVLFTWVLLDLWNPNRAATFEAIAWKRAAERHGCGSPSTNGQTRA